MTTPAYENLLVARDAGVAVLYTTADHLAARDAFSWKATPTFLGR